MKRYTRVPLSEARGISDSVQGKSLDGTNAETIAVPTGANMVLFAAANDIYVQYIEPTKENLVVNGTFASDTAWTKGTGWTIAAGKATSSGAQSADADLEQTVPVAVGLDSGRAYNVVFTVSGRSAGNVCAVLGGTEGTDRATNATFTQTIVAGANGKIALRADLDFNGSVDDFTVTPVASVPGDDASGYASELIKASVPEESRVRYLGGVSQISIIAATATVMTASFFKA